MCKALEDLYDEGRLEGRLEGRTEGQTDILGIISKMISAGEPMEAIKRMSEDSAFLEAMRSKYCKFLTT